MRRHDKEIKDQNIIQEILQTSELCRIGMVDNDEAYIVPVNYGYNNGVIYIHSAPHGRKMELLKKNNLVTFEIEQITEIVRVEMACNWTAKYRSVMGKGNISIVTEPDEKMAGMDIIMDKYGFEGAKQYDMGSLSRMVVLKLEIESVTGKQSGEF